MGQGSPWHASLTVGETYDDNIFFTHRKTSDEVTDIAPTIDFEKGDRTAVHQNYLNLYLAPTFFFYARHSDQNRQDDNADLYYQYQWTRLTLGVEAGYQHETDASVDVRDLIERNIYKTSVSGSYLYNDKLVISGSAADIINSYPTRSEVDTNDRYVEGYALYQVAPKLQLGGGTRSDFVEIKGAPDESIENLLLHMKYNPGGKIEGTFVGGAQYIEFQGNAADHVLPVFELSLGYTPVDGTGFSLSAWRRSVNSYDEAGKVYLTTGVELGVSHRLWRDFYVTAGASYDLYNYELGSSNDDATSFSRRDHFYYVHGGLEWTPQAWLRIEVHYRYTADDSSNSVFSFNDNQIGFQTFVGF